MLFEHVENVLHAGEVALADTIHPFVEPADRRAERDAVITNLSGGLSFLERFPDRVVVNLLHADVVKLEKIDMIRLQSLQSCSSCPFNCFWREVLGNLALSAAARFAVMDEIVADLGCDDDLIAPFRKCFPNQFLTQSIAVSIRGIE